MKMTMTTDYQHSYPHQRRQRNYVVLSLAAETMVLLVVGHQLQTTTAFMFLRESNQQRLSSSSSFPSLLSSQYQTRNMHLLRLSMTNDIKNINANTKKTTTMIEKKKDRIDVDNKDTDEMTSTVVATKQQITAELSTAPATPTTVETEEDKNTNILYNWMVTLLQEKGVVATFVNETSVPVKIGIFVVSVSLTYAAITLLVTTTLDVVMGWSQTAGTDVYHGLTVSLPTVLIHLWVSLWEILKVGIPLLVQAGLKVYAIVAPVVVETVTKGVEIASPILQETATKTTAAAAPYVDQMTGAIEDQLQAATHVVTEAVQGQTELIEAQLQDTAHAVNGDGLPDLLIHLLVSFWEILKVGITLLGQASIKVYAVLAPVVVETVTKGVEIASPILQETATKMTAAVAPYVDQMATNLVVPLQETVHDVTQAATNGVTEAVQGQTESIEAQLQDTAHAVNGAAEAKLHSATQSIDGFFFPEGSNNN